MNDLQNLCRICLVPSESGSLVPTCMNFIEQMQSHAGIMLSQLNNCSWPDKICIDCIALVKATVKLRKLCQKAEEQLQELDKKMIPVPNPDDRELETAGIAKPKAPLKILNGKLKQSSNEIGFTEIELKRAESTSEDCIDFIIHPLSPSRLPISSNSFESNVCHNVYMGKVKFAGHQRIHNKNLKPHECEICHKSFRQKPQLMRHMNSHTGLRPYKCKYCDSSFGDPSTRYKHQRIHTNERPFKCIYCDKSFNYSNVLDVHLKTHTGERPYSCTHCGQRFSQLHHKNTHEKGHVDSSKSSEYLS